MTRTYNYFIDVYRFVFTIIIMLHHIEGRLSSSKIFDGGYLGVEFFFILSGFLLYSAYTSDKYSSAFAYVKSRALQFFPIHIASILLIWGFNIYTHVETVKPSISELATTITKDFLYVINDTLFLQILAPSYNVSYVAWYISALIVVSFLLFWVLINFDAKITLGLFVITSLTLFWFIRELGHSDYYMIKSPALLRCAGEMCIGILCSYFSQYLKLGAKAANLLKFICLTGMLYIMFKYPHTTLDATFVIFAAVLITLEFYVPLDIGRLSEKTKLFCFGSLRKLALPLYFAQVFYISFLQSTQNLAFALSQMAQCA